VPAVKSRSIIWSFNHAIDGIVYALRTQRNMRVHVVIAAAAVIAAVLLGVTRLQLVAVIFAIMLVWTAELVNTAVEAAVDLATDHFDPLAKIAKDVAAGAVLVAATNALVVAYLVLFEPAKALLSQGMTAVRLASADLTVVAFGLTLLGVLVLKALSHEGDWMRGGWPSGHAALAFAGATVVGFITGSAGALAVCYFIAFLVAQSRVEAEIHTVPQVIVGALLGIVLVTLVFQLFFR